MKLLDRFQTRLVIKFLIRKVYVMNNNKVTSLLKSRRFWVAAAGVAAVVSSEMFGVTLDTDRS